MKSILIAIVILLSTVFAHAQDDRYFDSKKSYSATRAPSYAHKRVKAKVYAQRQHRSKVSVPRYAGETYSPDRVQWVARRVARGVGEVIGGRPSGAPSAWCGFWLGRHLGLLDRKLWLARNWASVGSPAAKEVGSIVVWRHHVGLVTDVSGARIKVLSGNDGHRVRNRWRNVGRVIAYRRI